MARFLLCTFSIVCCVMRASCDFDRESSAFLNNFDPNHLPSFWDMPEYHRLSMTPGSPPMLDIAGMQQATGIRRNSLQQLISAKSGAVATAETFEAESLSGYLFEIYLFGKDILNDFYTARSTKLNSCVPDYSEGSLIVTATANMITTTSYSDSSCTKKIAVKAVEYTSDSFFPKTVIAPTAAYPFPLSHVQYR